MRNRFDRQLHLLDEQLTHMGELCETAIAKATQALKDGSIEQAKVIIAEDEEIDQIEKDIERLCLKLLLQHKRSVIVFLNFDRAADLQQIVHKLTVVALAGAARHRWCSASFAAVLRPRLLVFQVDEPFFTVPSGL